MPQPPPVGKRPMLDRASLDRLLDQTPHPELNRVSPDGMTEYLHFATGRFDGTLYYRTRDRRGKHQMTIHVGKTSTPHGVLMTVTGSYPNHYPTWMEMRRLRDTFMPDATDVMMVLPGSGSHYISDHPYALWIWEMPEKWGWPPEDPSRMAEAVGMRIVNDIKEA